MLKNYLTTTIRFLYRNKLFTGINILGLSLALSVSFIILLFSINQLSYNTCFKNSKQIYRVISHFEDYKKTSAKTPYALLQEMREEFPQVKQVAAMNHFGKIRVKLNQETISINKVVAANSDIFKIFDLKLIGQQENILDQRNSIVLSKKQAQKLFQNIDPIGEEIVVLINKKKEVFVVRGIFDDIPVNSTFRANCFINTTWAIEKINKADAEWNAETDWDLNFWETWLMFDKKADIAALNTQFRALEEKVFKGNNNINFEIQKLTDVYLHSAHIDGGGIKGDIKNIRIFLAIALIVIIVATFNYIILSTAVSSGRANEIAIRKTNGASSQSIKRQLLIESVSLVLFVFPVVLFLTWIGKPYAEELFQTQLPIIKSNIAYYISIYLLLTLLIGLASGLYSSLYLSKLNVISIFKNPIQTGKYKTIIRSVLVVVQLIIFCIFVSSTLIIHSQYKFALERDPGYNNKNLLFVNVGMNPAKTEAFINNIKTYPNVISVGGSFEALPIRNGMPTVFEHPQDKTQKVNGQLLPINQGFIKTMGLTLIEGEDYAKNFTSENEIAFYVNETAVKKLGIKDPVGYATDPLGQHMAGGRIVGVIKDFNVYSIHNDIPPLFHAVFNDFVSQVIIRYQDGSLESLLPLIKKEWTKIAEQQIFDYKTIKDYNKEFYAEEKNLNTIISISALLTLFIATIGLFGLTLFTMKSQTQKIGIKKVFGSSERRIMFSYLGKNLIMLVIAIIISIPITTIVMNEWLSNFAFKTNIAWWIFAITFVLSAFVVLLTVLYHSHKASRINPVEALRYK
ncbi:MAG: ABC transporter permease [Bacteroidales bacterium]|nr:ABC transporter permease [Bacteroidales bacterium]